MDMCRLGQIFAAGHQAHSLDCVVDRDGEMIARRHLFASENHVAEQSGYACAGGRSRPSRAIRSARMRARHPAATQNRGLNEAGRRSLPWRAGGMCPGRPARRPVRSVAGARDLRLDLAPGAKARVKYAFSLEPVERPPVIGEMLRLLAHRAVPISPSHARSARMAAVYSSRQRVRSISSIRSRNRPPGSLPHASLRPPSAHDRDADTLSGSAQSASPSLRVTSGPRAGG